MDRVSIVLLSLVIVVVSAPLILRLVPPNPFYGLRTSRSLVDEGLWYQVNAFAGRALTLAALVSVIVAELSPDQWFTWPGFGLSLALTPLAAAVLASLLYSTTL